MAEVLLEKKRAVYYMPPKGPADRRLGKAGSTAGRREFPARGKQGGGQGLDACRGQARARHSLVSLAATGLICGLMRERWQPDSMKPDNAPSIAIRSTRSP